MGVTMSYQGVNLPKPLLKEVDDVVKRGYRGYRSRAEFVADAIRRYLDEITKQEQAMVVSK